MARVTALKRNQGRGKRLKISLDGKAAFGLEVAVVAREDLKVGQELSEGRIEALKRLDRFQRCFDAASHLLGYRPRSEAELRERLLRRGFDAEDVAAVLEKLREQGLVDDVAFACFWRDNRAEFSPRSRFLTGLELRQKGVSSDTIDQVVATIDDAESAYRAGRSKAGRLPANDYQLFRRRLGGYLKRRGFGYGVIAPTVARLWQELTTGEHK